MKAMQWLSKLIISAIITSMICVVSTFWVVNTYVDMILEQYHLKSDTASAPDWSKFMMHASKQLGALRLFGNQSGSNAAASKGQSREGEAALPVFGDQSGSNPSALDTTNSSSGSGKGDSQQPPSTGSTSQRKPPEDAVAVFGHQSGMTDSLSTERSGSAQTDGGASSAGGSKTGSAGAQAGTGIDTGGKVIVSSEEFAKKKEQLSAGDKNKVFNLLVKRVPQNEMQHISKLMEDGITASELKEIEQLLQSYLKPEEYSQLLGMIKQQ